MTDIVELLCKECGTTYHKPKEFVTLATLDDQWTLNSFYQRQTTFCDPCRRAKELSMLGKGFKKIVKSLDKQK